VTRARELAHAYDDLVPLDRRHEGFQFGGRRISFGSFQRGTLEDRPDPDRLELRFERFVAASA
jgi:hypothetical protein